MQRRFARWAILTILVLGGSSAVGIVVKAVIKPMRPDYSRIYGNTRMASPSSNAVPYELQSGQQSFQAPTPAAIDEAAEYTQLLTRLQFDAAASGRNLSSNFKSHFQTRRMAEEWVRFGVDGFRGQAATEASIAADDSTISRVLFDRIAADKLTFRFSEIEIVSVARSLIGQDRVVLVKHTTTIQGARATWHTRWWMTISGQLKVYDYEEQPHRLRVNAILASQDIVGYPAGPGNLVGSKIVVDELVERVAAMMETGKWSYLSPDDPLKILRFALPLDAIRQAVSKEPGPPEPAREVALLNESLAQWPGTPAIHLMIASLNGDRESIRKYREIAGNHPWADYLEAGIYRKKGDIKKARAILEKALKENNGHPILLEGLYHVLPSEERPGLGAQAAQGIAPSEAIRQLVNCDAKNRDDISKIIAAFRTELPDDPWGCLADAIQQAEAQNNKEAKALLVTAFQGVNRNERPQMKAFFLSSTKRLGRDGGPILDDPKIAALLN